MSTQDLTATRAWVQRWARVSQLVDKIGQDQDREVPLADVLPRFNESFRSALALHPAEPWSGLIEQQAVFRRTVR